MLKRFFENISTRKIILIIVVVGIVIYFNSLLNGFVGDDDSLILQNLVVHSLRNIGNFFSGSTFYNGGQQFVGSYYRPLYETFFSFVYSLFGPNYIAFHFFQICIHIANACLIFVLFRRFFNKPIAFFSSLIFLVHPINSEAVFYISAVQEPLFFFFGVVGLLLLIDSESNKKLLFSVLCLFLSLLSKEIGILFIMMASIYILLYCRKKLALFLGSSISLFGIYILLRQNAVGFSPKFTVAPIDSLNFLQRTINMPSIFLFYIKTFLLPLNLAYSHQWAYTYISFGNFYFPLVIDLLFILTVLYFGVFLYKKHYLTYFKVYIFFSIWFFVGVLLHLQIIPLDITVSERWFYFPIVGILGMLGPLISVVKIPKQSEYAYILAGMVILMLSIRTIVRSFDWRNQLTLASHDISVSSDSYDLENSLSYALLQQGRLDEAKIHAERSIKMYPYFTNYNNLGLIYLSLGDYPKAKEAYLNALQFGDYYLIYENLGGLTLVTGDPNENIDFLTRTLKKFPQDPKIWLYLAIVEYRQQNVEEARVAIANAFYYDPNVASGTVYNDIMNGKPLNIIFTTKP